MKIAIIGAGNIGGTLGRLWAAAGHQIAFGVRNPAAIRDLVASIGSKATAGSPGDAARGGEVLVFAGPFSVWPAFAKANAAELAGKVVLDAANPYPTRDGAMAESIIKGGKGSGQFVADLLPMARIVKAFNTIYWVDLRDKAHSANPKLAMPITGDDHAAVQLASRLAADAGFEPVVVGGLSSTVELDPGSPIYAKSFTAEQLRDALSL